MISPAVPVPDLLLTFHGDTRELLRRPPDTGGTVVYDLSRRASIKDIIEGLGVPHTEVGEIVLNGQEHTFELVPIGGERFDIHPLCPARPPTVATILRPEPLAACTFLVDINVGRLAALLRMVGCDAAAVSPHQADPATRERAVAEKRILLTRNRELLKQRRLVFGRLVRSQEPLQQLREIIGLYGLHHQLRPFSRCIACNGMLVAVAKEAIVDRLLPLTKKYYTRFKECTGCGKIYWHGSHHQRMTEKLDVILGNGAEAKQ